MIPRLTILSLLAAATTTNASNTYQYDDGISNITLGPPSSFEEFGDIDVLWGNYFIALPNATYITQIDFGLGSLSSGAQDTVHIWIFNDPDNDEDPTNAIPIYTTTVTAQDMGFDFNELPVPGIQVNQGFFVAVGHLAELDSPGASNRYPSPVRFDPDARPDRSWFFYDSDIPETNLANAGFVQRMDGPFVPIQGAFAIRTTAVQTDPCPTNVVRDSSTDIEDLLLVLRSFGLNDNGDTNNDNNTDIEDLLAVLREFGSTCP